jgi:hypothetical protein
MTLLQHNQAIGDSDPPDDGPPFDVNELETLRIRMSHGHLLLLEAAEFIAWHRDSQELEKGANFEDIRPLLEFLGSNAMPVA